MELQDWRIVYTCKRQRLWRVLECSSWLNDRFGGIDIAGNERVRWWPVCMAYIGRNCDWCRCLRCGRGHQPFHTILNRFQESFFENAFFVSCFRRNMIPQPRHHAQPSRIIEFRKHERWLCHSFDCEGTEFLYIYDSVQGNSLAGRHWKGYPRW